MTSIRTGVLISMTVLLISVNFLLIRQNLSLKEELDSVVGPKITKGTIIPNYEVRTLDGEIGHTYKQNGIPTVVFVFSSSCPYCHEQMEDWIKFSSRVKQGQVNISAIALDSDAASVRGFLKTHGVANWDVRLMGSETAARANFRQTPLTVILDKDGRVEHSVTGLWTPADVRKMNDHFGIQNPTL